MNYLVTNISWDTDGEEEDTFDNLPEECILLNINETEYSDTDEAITDHLSSIYGFCINTYNYTPFEDTNSPVWLARKIGMVAHDCSNEWID